MYEIHTMVVKQSHSTTMSSITVVESAAARYLSPGHVLAPFLPQVTEALATGIDVRLEHVVTSVAVAPDGQVTVTCQGDKQLQSKAVVVAVPLKVRLCTKEAAYSGISK